MIKVHIPTMEYGFIEAEYETLEEALAAQDNVQNMVKEKNGLPVREWTQVRKTMLNTGEFDPNLSESLSKAQRYWVNQTKLALRDIKKEGDEVE